jgi:hypothetical protein
LLARRLGRPWKFSSGEGRYDAHRTIIGWARAGNAPIGRVCGPRHSRAGVGVSQERR